VRFCTEDTDSHVEDMVVSRHSGAVGKERTAAVLGWLCCVRGFLAERRAGPTPPIPHPRRLVNSIELRCCSQTQRDAFPHTLTGCLFAAVSWNWSVTHASHPTPIPHVCTSGLTCQLPPAILHLMIPWICKIATENLTCYILVVHMGSSDMGRPSQRLVTQHTMIVFPRFSEATVSGDSAT
jgi:hypothetical protein